MGFLDIRIEKTERAIKQAFMQLREQKQLEKMRVKDLCDIAHINKSTFYAHYQDIYELSNALENSLISDIVADIPQIQGDNIRERTDWLTQELFKAFRRKQDEAKILFSGSRQGLFVKRIEEALKKKIGEADPGYWDDPARGILLSFCVHGCYYTFMNNYTQMDERRLLALLSEIARAAQNINL